MRRMNEIFKVEGLDFLTTDERAFNDLYVKKLMGYAKGEVEGVMIKNLSVGAATIAKRQQSRSAAAALAFSIASKTGEPLGEDHSKNDKLLSNEECSKTT